MIKLKFVPIILLEEEHSYSCIQTIICVCRNVILSVDAPNINFGRVTVSGKIIQSVPPSGYNVPSQGIRYVCVTQTDKERKFFMSIMVLGACVIYGTCHEYLLVNAS